jgi:hypothetical protein
MERPERAGRAQPLQDQFGQPGVVQALVDGPPGERPVGRMPDERVREMGRQGIAYAEEELVAVLRPGDRGGVGNVGLFDAYEQVQQPRAGSRRRQQLGRRDEREAGDGPALAGEPALPRKPFT